MTKAIISRAILLALLWWILAEGRNDGWQLGAVAVLAGTWASIRLAPPGGHHIRIAGLLGFLGFFLWNSIRGGLQVAGMALRGRTALQPALLELRVTLPQGGPRMLLVNTLSLMPGTLGVDISDTTLRLHVLDDRLPVLADARALEAVIARLFGASA